MLEMEGLKKKSKELDRKHSDRVSRIQENHKKAIKNLKDENEGLKNKLCRKENEVIQAKINNDDLNNQLSTINRRMTMLEMANREQIKYMAEFKMILEKT
jgi:chromosome segregation ATPase